jgi:hypothetical protein
MFNIRARHLERDLVEVHAAFGDTVDGLSFEFANRRSGAIQAIGGRLGPSGITMSSHQVTECSATLPAGRHLKYEKARRGTVVQQYGESNLVSSGGSSFLTSPGVSQMAFLEDAGPVESMSVNLPVDTLDRYLAMAEETLSNSAGFVVLDGASSTQDAPLTGLMDYVLKNLSLCSTNRRLAELADALLLETYISFLRSIGYLRPPELLGFRPDTRRRDRSAHRKWPERSE